MLPIQKRDLQSFCRRHHICRLSLFGSVLTGTATAESNIDLLVEFEPGRIPGLLAIASMEQGLSAMLGGHKVNLHTPNDLSPHFRDEVLRTARVEYAA